MDNYLYWQVWYVSYEGNTRWTSCRTKLGVTHDQVMQQYPLGGMGDEPNIITSVEDYHDDGVWDHIEIN